MGTRTHGDTETLDNSSQAAVGEALSEKVIGGDVVTPDPSNDKDMPELMTVAEVIEPSGEPTFGKLLDEKVYAGDVGKDGEGKGVEEVEGRDQTTGETGVEDGEDTSGAHEEEDGDTDTTVLTFVEPREPREDGTDEAHDSGGKHVGIPGTIHAVETVVLGDKEGGGDEEGDTHVIEGGGALHGGEMGVTGESVVHDGAEEALCDGGEEDKKDGVIEEGSIEGGEEVTMMVDGKAEEEESADEVSPYVSCLIMDLEDGVKALGIGGEEAVSCEDVLILLPLDGELLKVQESATTGLHGLKIELTGTFGGVSAHSQGTALVVGQGRVHPLLLLAYPFPYGQTSVKGGLGEGASGGKDLGLGGTEGRVEVLRCGASG